MLTNHARDKLDETGLTVEDVITAIRYGFASKVSSTYYFWNEKITVVIKPNYRNKKRVNYSIVTVYPTFERRRGFEPLRKRWVKRIEGRAK